MNAMIPLLIGCTPLVINAIRSSAKRRKAERAESEAAAAAAAKQAEQAAAARRAAAAAAAAAAAKQAEKARAVAERKAAAEEKHRDAMRRQQERHAQKLQHISEIQAAKASGKTPATQDMTPDEFAARFAPVPAEAAPTVQASQPSRRSAGAFAGHVVSFTGTLTGMTRAEAIKAVEDNGGKAYTTMPAGTTLLVVGENPGMGKMDKADRWIGQTRKITQAQFMRMLTPESEVSA